MTNKLEVAKYVQIHQDSDGETSMYDVTSKYSDGNNDTTEIRMDFSIHDIQWSPSIRGTVAMELNDHGDGIIIESEGKSFDFDYNQFAILKGLMRIYDNELKKRDLLTETTYINLKEID